MRHISLTQTSYRTYIGYLAQNTLADTAHYIEKEFPVLHDTERLKGEAGSEWFWETSRKLTGIADSFNFAYIYYIEKTDAGYIFLMSSGINEDVHPEWLHGPVWEGETPAFIDEAWKTKTLAFSTEPTVNEWGTLISAELPIVNDGVVVGVLGVDYDISFLDDLRNEETLLGEQERNLTRVILRLLVFSLIFILVILCFQMFITYKWVLVPIQMVEAENRTRLMLDSTPLACFLMDKVGRIYDSNMEAVTLFGAESKEYLEKHFFNFMPEYQPTGRPSRDEAIARILAAMETGSQRFEWIHRTSSGGIIPAEITLVRVNWHDGYRVAGFVRDLTGIKANEEKKREAKKQTERALAQAEMSSKAKSDFLGRMSREMRAPMNAIIDMTAAAKTANNADQRNDCLEQIEESSRHLSGLVNDLLDMAETKTG
jgi:PAS domain S-box-containing protein